MSEKDQTKSVNLWLIIGIAVLIALLFLWLIIADFSGDTDVAALILP